MNNPSVTGQYVSMYTLADRFGVGLGVINAQLLAMGLLEQDIGGAYLATERAEKSRLWDSSGPRFLGGGSWDTCLIPVLSGRIGKPAVAGAAAIRVNRDLRKSAESGAYVARLRSATSLAEEAKRVREAELSKLTGMHRVARMISERERVMDPQYSDEGWAGELSEHHSRAMSVAREHSFLGDYPDFENELIDRVIFTLDEQMVAARRFEDQGRAVPMSTAQPATETAGRRA